MRKRQPKHENQLKSIQGIPSVEVIRRIGISDYESDGFIDSEVLAYLIRNRVREPVSVVENAVVELNKRIQLLVKKRLRGETWHRMLRRGNTVVEDTIGYVWDKLLEEEGVSNCEVYFGRFVRDRVDDYMRSLLAEKNSMESIDGITVENKDGEKTPVIDTLKDDEIESPEECVMRAQQTTAVRGVLMMLPQVERNAFYFREICGFEWKKVAEFLDCSIPTARKHLERSLEKLQGVME